MEASVLKGTRLICRVKPHNMTWPRSAHSPGSFAIVKFDVLKIMEGNIPDECLTPNGDYQYQVCAKGNMPKISFTSEYILQGTLVIDKEYGAQYTLESLRLDYDMTKEEDQRKFFSYFLTERQIDLLFDGSIKPIDLLENKNIGELSKIKGIGPVTATRMCMRYEDSKDNGRAYIELKELDLTKAAIDNLVKRYGSADLVVDKIKENPYILIKEVRGYGWKRCDAIARKQGFAVNSRERVNAYTEYYLYEQANTNGNSWVSIEDLLTNVAAECAPIEKETLMGWVRDLIIDPTVFEEYYARVSMGLEVQNINEMPLLFYDPGTRRVGLLFIRIIEKEISRHLARIRNAESKFKYSKTVCDRIIKEVEDEQGFEYTDEQRKAIDMILDSNVSVLTGFGGTGKSNTLTAVVRIFKHYGEKVDQCALSGRASSRMSEITGVEGKTIHRLLSYMPDYNKFAFNERNKLHSDVVLCDEVSMIGAELFLDLVEAIDDGAKLVLIGDHHQLEAIGLANILKDCLQSGYVKTTVLTKIHRQAAASGIITQSLKVSAGEQVVRNDFIGEELRGELKDFKIISAFDSQFTQYNIVKEFKRLYQSLKISADDIQVVVPMRTRGEISCRVLNEVIQNIVNPAMSLKQVYVDFFDNGMRYQVCFKPGDRIMVLHNNYRAIGTDGEEKQIFNGNLGYIKDIAVDAMVITVNDVGDIVLPKEQWTDINLGYALTVHKLQGSQAPYCIVGLDSSCYAMYSKELVYTALTRATKYCALVTQPKAINSAVRISRVRTKQTWLKSDLMDLYIQEEESKAGE